MKLSDIKAKRSLGQNFLINQGVLDKIVQAAEITSEDTVLEVGPGTGNLTKKLGEKAGRVIAVEKDRRLIDSLREQFKNSNVEIVEGDVLKLDIGELFRNLKLEIRNSNYKVVGNIPYYITSNFLRTVFDPAGSGDTADRQSDKGRASNGAGKWPKPKLIVLTIQKEVAQRIMAKPPHMNPVRSKASPQGSPAGHARRAGRTSNGMNLLALSVQFYSSPTIIGYVSKGSFRPVPKVDSAIIKLVPQKDVPADKDLFFKLIKAGFAGKRRQLANNLGKNLGLPKDKVIGILKELGLDEKIRAENLPIEKWAELSRFL